MTKHIPNILTTFRLTMIPLFVYFVVFRGDFVAAAIVFAVAGITDVVDGFAARKLGAISNFGKLYDPLVDKLFQISVVICLFVAGILPMWIVIFIIFKEVNMLILSAVLYVKKVVVHSLWFGKAASIVFYAAIGVMLITPERSVILDNTLIGIVVASAVLSGVGYFFENCRRKNNGINY